MAKAISTRTDFLTSKAKKTFIHLQKTFTKALIIKHFDLECYIYIETNALEYAIGRILSQMILDQSFFDHVTHKNLDPNFSKSEIGQ